MKLAGGPARARTRRAELRLQRTSSAPAPASRESARPAAKERSLARPAAERGELPDLLHAQPAISVDEAALLHALSFAFVAGSAGGSLRSALSRTAIAASSFSPDTLSDGLFLDELLSIGFEFSSGGKPAPLDRAQLRKLISRPPSELEHVLQRQAILRELAAEPALLGALEQLYAALAGLPALLDDEGSDGR